MSVGVRDRVFLGVVAALVFFTNLGDYPLFDEDEPKNAVCSREMFLRGDWIVPTFNEELRTDKPILIYWLMLTSFHLFGVSEFAARFGSSLLSLGTALGTYFLGHKLYDRNVGLLSGLVVVTCLMFSAVGRAVTPDATLVCCLTWVFCGFVWAWKRSEGTGWSVEVRRSAVPMYAAMGLAMLAKGPVGFLLPCLAIGFFGLCQSTCRDLSTGHVSLGEGRWWRRLPRLVWQVFAPSRCLTTLRSMHLGLGVLVAFGIALPWYVLVGWRTEGAWLAGFLGGHNVQRFLEPMEQHRGPPVYYLIVLFAGTFPWSVFLPMAVRNLWQRVATRSSQWDSDLFLASWAATWLVFFSLAQTKLPNYILPIYPAVAIIVSRSLIAWMQDLKIESRGFLLECRVLALVGVAMIVGLMIAMTILLPKERPLALLGVIPIATAAAAHRWAQARQRLWAVSSLAVGAVALAVGITAVAPVRLAGYQDSPFFARAAQSATPYGVAEIATVEVFEPSLVYYHGQKIHRPAPENLAAFLDEHPQGMILTRSDKLDRLPPDVAERLVEVARQRRFLRRHDLILLGQSTVITAGHRQVQ